jgi:NAD(P)-dependent dehydrogenase (short-subunit alcohol dehydrogenase family)
VTIDLTGKVAIVTGAAQGIGRAYAEGLAGAGASVVVADVDIALGEEGVKQIVDGGGKAAFVETDVAAEASVQLLVDTTLERFGGIDIVVNNAGIWGAAEKGHLAETSVDYWNLMMAVNLTSMFLLVKAAMPSMIERGGGAVVNQSSIGAYLVGASMPHYCTSKGAVNTLTKAMAKDLGVHNIRVNAIAPGCIATPGTLGQIGTKGIEMFIGQQCLKRTGEPDDLIGPLLFLVSDQSKFVTGQVLVVDGGVHMLG